MAKAKIEDFTTDESTLADIAKALSHPARIKILKILSEMDVCMCGEIVDLLPLAQATVSQHLKELKRVGLIKGEIEGPKTCYCVDVKATDNFYSMIKNYFENISKECKKSCKTQTK
jgi:ArsR family transcriptional regulator, arsenate/arsenite/antimonite-responsive transcriptional repressor